MGDTTVVEVDTAEGLHEVVLRHLDRGESLLCVDACGLAVEDAEDFVTAAERCARLVERSGGHLTFICPHNSVRRPLWAFGLSVLSDRDVAQTVLA